MVKIVHKVFFLFKENSVLKIGLFKLNIVYSVSNTIYISVCFLLTSKIESDKLQINIKIRIKVKNYCTLSVKL